MIDCIVFIIACFSHLESVSKCIFHISFFLSADSLSSALLVGLSKEGRKEGGGRKDEDYFQILEKNGRIEVALGVKALGVAWRVALTVA